MKLARAASIFHRYGPWAVVAGASEGLGEAFAEVLAGLGFNLLLVARRGAVLGTLAKRLEHARGISVRCVVADLGAADTPDLILNEIEDLEIGLVVYNAAFAPIGPLIDRKMDELMKVVDVNVRGPLGLVHRMLPRMVTRVTTSAGTSPPPRRAGFILMSSLSGNQGSPGIAAYSASKAFNSILAQGLWHELKADGIDFMACCAGAIRTPGYLGASQAGESVREAPGTLAAPRVATVALKALGRTPMIVPGFVNKAARFFMNRMLPTKVAIRVMAASTKDLN